MTPTTLRRLILKGRAPSRQCGAAIRDAHISLDEIDYINLHGTGTVDNDLSEARALNTLFPRRSPWYHP